MYVVYLLHRGGYWHSGVMLLVKNLPANAGDTRDVGSIPGLERSPGEGNGNPLQYSHLENPMDRGAWGLKKLDTTEQLSTHAWGSEWEMPIGLSCYIFCFNLTVLNLDWSLELPLLDSAWDIQICSYQCHKNTFENKWRVAQESLETSWVSRCTFWFKDLIWRKILNSSGTKREA